MKPVLFLLLVSHFAAAQTLPDERKGSVKTVERFSYRHEPGEEAYLLIHSRDSFNRKGQLVESVYFKDSRDLVDRRYRYQYDAKGNNTRSVSEAEGDGVTEIEEIRYDAKGNKLEWTTYDWEKKPTGQIKFTYDKAGRMIESSHFNDAGVKEFTLRYRYNEKGEKAEYWREQPQGQRQYRFLYTYGANARLLTEQYEDDKEPGKNTKTHYTYNPDGLLSRMEEYDSKGIVERKVVVDWIFDDRGNWTRRFDAEEVFHEKGSYTTEVRVQRIISYY